MENGNIVKTVGKVVIILIAANFAIKGVAIAANGIYKRN